MPIALRDLQGRAIPLPIEARFIEVQSNDRRLAAVIFTDKEGVVIVSKPGDSEFEAYANGVGLVAARHIPIMQPAG